MIYVYFKVKYNPFIIVEWLPEVFSQCFLSRLSLISTFLFAGMNTLIGYDLVPEPKILEAALRACRRLDDLASAIRILEAVKVRNGLVWAPHTSGSAATLISWVLLVNDWLGACHLSPPQDKAGSHKDIYPYVIQELGPTLNELGISTPEELGIDKV